LTTPRLRCDWYYSWNGCRVCSNKAGTELRHPIP
jgi:hypothetical protein